MSDKSMTILRKLGILGLLIILVRMFSFLIKGEIPESERTFFLVISLLFLVGTIFLAIFTYVESKKNQSTSTMPEDEK